MMAYAGIGSRKITEEERVIIENLAEQLSKNFLLGSQKKCVLTLPWHSFNHLHYDPKNARQSHAVGKEEAGQKAIDRLHPVADKLSYGARLCLSRNYYQIHGLDENLPPVKFVVCCANTNANGEIIGGTGHAVRIASELGVPTFNIRQEGWDHSLQAYVSELLSSNG